MLKIFWDSRGIQAVPTLMLFRKGQTLWRQSGMMSRADLLAVIDRNQ